MRTTNCITAIKQRRARGHSVEVKACKRPCALVRDSHAHPHRAGCIWLHTSTCACGCVLSNHGKRIAWCPLHMAPPDGFGDEKVSK